MKYKFYQVMKCKERKECKKKALKQCHRENVDRERNEVRKKCKKDEDERKKYYGRIK